jgi:hypothetical protein
MIMQNVADIFASWPSDAELARDLGVPYPPISAWKQRGSIPAAYWWHVTRAARGRGLAEVTLDLLARIHARKTNDGPSGFEEERADRYEAGSASLNEEDGHGPSAAGHFSRFKHLRRAHFASAEEISAHISALRDEWERQ